jgi:hypothetical protein
MKVEEEKIQETKQKKMMKEGILQNKMVNSAVCGNIENWKMQYTRKNNRQ